GKVVAAGDGGAYGNQVVIRHSDGMYSQYAHMSKIKVSVGDTVRGGTVIGLSGATGNVSGPHLHMEVRTGPDYGTDINP
ncbi:M23 family metallopeptidase, partial [Streptomyces sp. SID6648]|nr:M23 family metallopeptidase [Streptomyces sp. SID6648]